MQINYDNKNKRNLFFLKKKFFLFLLSFLEKNKGIFFLENKKFLIYFLEKIYVNVFYKNMHLTKNFIIIFFYFIYIFLLNFIYNLIRINLYIFFYLFNFIYIFLNKYAFIIKYIILFLFLFYFYSFINFFFIILYKHYILYFPLLNIKENFHFLNFEWIDLRNYFNIIKLHNIFIDLNVHNNFIYNEVLKQLNINLNKYNFKFSPNININLYVNNITLNKDTSLLNDVFQKWNKYHGSKYIRRWKKYKRMLNWSLRGLYKGKDWYRAVKREKLRSSVLPLFNNGRYFENTKTEISNNMGFWETLNQVKRLPYNKDIKLQFQKSQAWYTYFKKRHTSKKRPRFLISYYVKLKNIPFNYIYKEFNLFFLKNYEKHVYSEFDQYIKNIKILKKNLNFFKNFYIRLKYSIFNTTDDRLFFFKKYYRNFLNEKNTIIWKNHIPTLLITETRIQRIPPITTIDRFLNDYISMSHTDEMQQYIHYKDLSKKGCLKNSFFKIRYIYKKYPYRLNKKRYYQYVIKNYFNLIDTGIKISKKYYFFERSKLRSFNKLSHRLLNKIDTIYSNQLLKYKYWDKVFFFKRLNDKKYDFWSFFDYIKVNKYKILKKKIILLYFF